MNPKTTAPESAKHSSGTWFCNGSYIETEHRCIAKVGTHNSRTPEDDANARLIAAAPRMLSWMERSAPNWDDEAREIIASIRGGGQ